jgi:5-methylcytosine-specific restriction endonuclease McrA
VIGGSYCDEHAREHERDRWRARPWRGDPAWHKARAKARRRDKNRCTVCGSRVDLSVHHVNGNAEDHRLENLRTLCATHHAEATAKLREAQRLRKTDAKLAT